MPANNANGTVLVAGGAGYIGSHTSKQLQAAGMRPVVVDNLSTGNRFALRFGDFVEGAIENRDLIRRTVEQHQVHSAILFAGYIAVGESVQAPRKYYYNNVAGALAFLDALLDSGVRNVVFSSSAAVYGVQGAEPISETASMNPLSPYAETKLFIEQVLRAYSKPEGLRSVSLRYFNAAGADADGEIGERHDPETHLIPLAIFAAMGRRPLSVFGTDYPTPDGTAIRDYIHVTDLADAHVAAVKYLRAGGDTMSANLGTGSGHSVRQVMEMVEQISGSNVTANYGPRRAGDAPALVADPSKARRLLEWTPRHSSLENIVQTAWRWHAEHEAKATDAH
jgi:UDP-arabinose 4-epimerase